VWNGKQNPFRLAFVESHICPHRTRADMGHPSVVAGIEKDNRRSLDFARDDNLGETAPLKPTQGLSGPPDNTGILRAQKRAAQNDGVLEREPSNIRGAQQWNPTLAARGWGTRALWPGQGFAIQADAPSARFVVAEDGG
jgi:hypothetical protein